MIIFGTRRTVQRLMVLMLACPQGHPAAHTVLRLVTKFTLFFVPLFPIRTHYQVQCTLCGMSGQVDATRADELVAMGHHQAAASQAPTPPHSLQQPPPGHDRGPVPPGGATAPADSAALEPPRSEA